jgi:hypothetical protein
MQTTQSTRIVTADNAIMNHHVRNIRLSFPPVHGAKKDMALEMIILKYKDVCISLIETDLVGKQISSIMQWIVKK